MSFIQKYSDYKWIKVKRYDGFDHSISTEANYTKLLAHHEKEATFLIDEIRKLAATMDEKDTRLIELERRTKEIEEELKRLKKPIPKDLENLWNNSSFEKRLEYVCEALRCANTNTIALQIVETNWYCIPEGIRDSIEGWSQFANDAFDEKNK